MEMVIFEGFVFAFMKDISNGSPILCEFFFKDAIVVIIIFYG
jgi:hypothetical protein